MWEVLARLYKTMEEYFLRQIKHRRLPSHTAKNIPPQLYSKTAHR